MDFCTIEHMQYVGGYKRGRKIRFPIANDKNSYTHHSSRINVENDVDSSKITLIL